MQTMTNTTRRVESVRSLTESTFVVRFDRAGMEFEPGQYVSVGVAGDINMREYSIYSPVDADYLEILVKLVEGGHVSRALARMEPGARLEVDGPFGFFLIDDPARTTRRFLFVSTGTGISPFHCFAGSYPQIDYTLLHGVRTLDERYEYSAYDPARVTTCVSREAVNAREGLFAGRVTDYLKAHPVAPETLCYLCGNCDMIYEAFDILKRHGVPPEQLFAEVYF
ncbi:MAG: oxidoreductase [Spirochaetaceae bacterium]|nr:MAG: oxidoreductase [Spirochaetaceae bacterium]